VCFFEKVGGLHSFSSVQFSSAAESAPVVPRATPAMSLHIRASAALAFLCALSRAALPAYDEASADGPYTLELLDPASGALCLDGSPGGFYHRAASPDVWVLEQEGGGWCWGDSDCLDRSRGDIGSSRHWPRAGGVPGMDGGSRGMFSGSAVSNPHFFNATRIHLNWGATPTARKCRTRGEL